MQINVTYDSSVNNAPAGFKDCVAAACAYFDTAFTQPITLNISVGYGEIAGQSMDAGALGESQFNDAIVSYAQLRNALLQENAPGASTLPVSDPTGLTLTVTTAEAKALGIVSRSAAGTDGWVGISTSDPFTFDPNNRAVSGKYDLVGTLEHEISEIMGRASSLDNGNSYAPLDLFRYKAPHLLQLGSGGPSYFSVDGGVTSLDAFNNHVTGDSGDLGDWAWNAGADAFLDDLPSGQTNVVTQTDITEMEALGWLTSTSAPSTGSIAWSNATYTYTAAPGSHISIALPFASTAVTLSISYDGSTVDLYSSGLGNRALGNIEFLQFTDKTMFVETADNANLARLYVAAFDRAPDISGLSAWENIYTQVSASAKAAGTYVSLAETSVPGVASIAAGFTNSAEFQQKYGALSDTAFVTQLYENVLGRTPDANGLNAWLTLMHQGDASGQIFTREMVLVGFAESPENVTKAAGDWLFQV